MGSALISAEANWRKTTSKRPQGLIHALLFLNGIYTDVSDDQPHAPRREREGASSCTGSGTQKQIRVRILLCCNKVSTLELSRSDLEEPPFRVRV